MFLEILLALLLGVLFGMVTGIIPGLHVNLIAALLLTISPVLLFFFSSLPIAVFIVSLAITHTFVDALPSIYLSAPDEAQALNSLPGQRLLLQGRGHEALLYTVLGSLGSLLLCMLLLPLLILLMRNLSSAVQPLTGFLLLGLLLFLLWREPRRKLFCLTIFLLAGALGLLVFKMPQLRQPLFPLLSGLFGASLLVSKIGKISHLPLQKKSSTTSRLSTKDGVVSVAAASGAGFFAAFLPGVGNSQMAVLATSLFGDRGDEAFLTLVGGINTASMLISLGTAYAIEKARNGAVAALNQLLGGIGKQEVILFALAAVVAGSVAAVLTLRGSRLFVILLNKVEYEKIILGVLAFLLLMSTALDGIAGVAILGTATALGILAQQWKVSKHYLMGCLILPVLLYFLG